MDINRLKKDELIYELAIRGIASSPAKTVDELRSCLRPMLKLEKAKTSLSYPEYNMNLDEEFKIISSKYAELKDLLSKLQAGTLKQSPEVIRSRLLHLLHRLDKISSYSLSPEQTQVRSDLLANALELLDFLDTCKQPAEVGGLELLFSETRSQDEATTSASNPIQLPIQASVSNSFQPVLKWNLRFSGDPRSISVHNFLERVQELRVARNVSEQQLVESAIDLFEGKALLWYRSNKYRITDWKSLCELLIKHYEPPDYKDRLFEELLARTQDPSESFIEYYSCMLSMFRRYGQVTEDIQLRIISKNLAPFYTMQLPSVASLAELEDECLKLEQKKHRADSYRPPSRSRNTRVEPDFAFVGTSNFDSRFRPAVVSAAQVNRSAKCYNCDQPGHSFRECVAPRRLFCYRCGRLDVTVRRCPNCSGPENIPGRR